MTQKYEGNGIKRKNLYHLLGFSTTDFLQTDATQIEN